MFSLISLVLAARKQEAAPVVVVDLDQPLLPIELPLAA
jgi:hypothetical protein